MDIASQIEADLKAALLAGDKDKVSALRNIKSALQYESVGKADKNAKLSDEDVQKVLAREAKKRQESADAYKAGGSPDRAEAELAEKAIIEAYLPAQVSEAEIEAAVKEEAAKFANPTAADMGKIIGAVRARFGASADGGVVARLVKQTLES